MAKIKLKVGDVVRVDHDAILHDGRPIVSYVCIQKGRKKYLVAFDGNCNCEERPSGWYEIEKDDDLPLDTISVYRPTYIGCIFSGDFTNRENYKKLL